jgi:CRP-like cAMP-binding protein
MVTEISDGGSFGELALISEATRQAMVICTEECEFVTLNKADFRKIVFKYNEKEKRKTIEFFRKFQIFKKWDENGELDKLSYYSDKKDYRMGDIIYKPGDTNKDLYILKHGEIRWFKNYMVEPNPLLENMTELDR